MTELFAGLPHWQIFIAVGVITLIFEMFMPMMFFLSFAIGAFITAVFAVWFLSWNVLLPLFAVVSIVSLALFRPFLAKTFGKGGADATGIAGKYIGKKVKALSEINANSGAIEIYGERWNARCEDGAIPEGAEVEIVKNDSLIMYVKKAAKSC